MIIGVPTEIKENEYQVGIVPAGVKALTVAGHSVLIEQGAGVGSGISDQQYRMAGATLATAAADIYGHQGPGEGSPGRPLPVSWHQPL